MAKSRSRKTFLITIKPEDDDEGGQDADHDTNGKRKNHKSKSVNIINVAAVSVLLPGTSRARGGSKSKGKSKEVGNKHAQTPEKLCTNYV